MNERASVVAPVQHQRAGSRPHVVMLLANPFTHDTRVNKEARALQSWACDVTVVARDGQDLPAREVREGVSIRRIPFAQASLLGAFWLLLLLRLGVDSGVRRHLLGRQAPAPAQASPQGWTLRRLWMWPIGILVLAFGSLAGLVLTVLRAVWSVTRGSLRLLVDAVRGGPQLVFVDFPVALLAGVGAMMGAGRAAVSWVLRGAVGAAKAVLRRIVPKRVAYHRWALGVRWRLNKWFGGWLRPSSKRRTTWSFSQPFGGVSRLERWLQRTARRIRSRWISWWVPKRRALVRRRTLLRADLRKRVRAALPAQAPILAMNVPFARDAARLEPSVVVAHDLNMLLAGLAVRRLTGCHLVYDSHELYLERNIGDRSRFKENLFWKPIERLAIGECDAVMSVADGICRHLETRYRIPRPHLIRNVQPYEPPASRSNVLADSLGVSPKMRLGIYAGAITINRGIEQLIEAAQYLDRSTAFVIMGYSLNPAFLEGLREQAASLGVLDRTLFFHDAVPMDQVVKYVSSAAVSVVPTRNVCLSYYFEASNKIFHSLMAGVPVAMSDHPEKRLLVEEHGVGVLFDETEPRNIARAVQELLDDEVPYAKMQENCVVAARSLNWEHEQYRLRMIFAGLLGDAVPTIPPVEIPPVATAIA